MQSQYTFILINIPKIDRLDFYASAPKVPEALCFRVVRPDVRPDLRPDFSFTR